MEDTHFLVVKLIESNNCFVKVARKILQNQPLCIVKVTIGGQFHSPHYFTALGHDDKSSETIHFPQVLGQQLGLNNGSLVPVRFVKERPPDCHHCNLVLIEPKGIGIDVYKNEMTDTILDQIRIVYPGLVFPFLTSCNTILIFKVTQTKPNVNFCILVQDSLLEIGQDENQASLKVSSVTGKFISFLSFFNNSNNTNDGDATDTVDSVILNYILCKNIDETITNTIFNVLPAPSNLDVSSVLNTVWVNAEQFDLSGDDFGVLILNKLLPPCEKSKKNEQKRTFDTINRRADSIDPQEEDLFLSTYILVRGLSSCPVSSIYSSDNLRMQMDLSHNCKIFFHRGKFPTLNDGSQIKIPAQDSIHLSPINLRTIATSESIRQCFKSYISKHKILMLCRGSCIEVNGQGFIISCDPEKPCIPIDEKNLDKLDIRIKSVNFKQISTSWGKRLPLMKLPELSGSEIKSEMLTVYLPYPFIPWMENQISSATNFLNRILNQENSTKEIIKRNISFARNVLLVHGPKGSGKTCFLKHVIELTKQKFPSVFIKTIQCGSWKTISSLKKQWITQIAECIYAQPSVLIFEGLDQVAPHISRLEEVPGADTIASIRASCIFSSIIKSFDELNIKFGQKIALVATCNSQSSLNPILTSIRGRSVFSETINLENPNFEQRRQIIKSFLDHHTGSINSTYQWLDQISYRCEGYLIADLLNLVDSAIHNKVTTNQTADIGPENFEEALQIFRPSMMTDIRIEKNNGISFKDIGGLNDVKNLLRSTLLLPIKYPILFSKCPIRPPRNILLYGAPGTGKSLLAEALASESKVNLIKIRGPELLSKYIGKSEESIRELFERAVIAKPCIIFFDEFESLAPRRGQDTTGVTDRVVNQLLAQMDGVEVIEQGVYAIAATSRPDLLDPALLRPGRFDKYICCDFPSDDDRLDIWKVLGKNINFDEGFNHSIIPELTENFTGADIRALLINSQYEAIEKHEENVNLTNLPINNEAIKISESHVLSAKLKTKPCIDSVKRAEYRFIYDKFSGIETSTLPMQQRATLA
ncbi:peroxisome biogenesis factor 1 [Tetranychus urticae]|uniref:peroxisome biogenesis factor 1 n=1 Tax=Tetranychus urticae TaxID=32264 RepID=UPI00077C059C|nr:peroxisome biogenesis factor 1 [Tetranychus urticae]